MTRTIGFKAAPASSVLRISIIVPVYNELEIVPELLKRLTELGAWEIIVVDGGSIDGTWRLLNQLRTPPIQLQRTATGRARQMNDAALRATGEVLLFLHADTLLPVNATKLIIEGLDRKPGCRWGRFDVRFDRAGPILKLVAGAMNLRSAWTSICTGDQAVFVYREVFVRLGGFAPVPLMEDVDLSQRLKRQSRPLRIRKPATTSSRRWQANGVWRTIGLMWRLRWLYWRGIPASALAARYRKNP
ncbi:MAG: Undecaprenyl-phosphate 4-deoxy-4-formamido-L-arabinose transferase [Gammaproteobacteria bacterium]|nr:Undecaprenyl-phosphate 4-deoxy-4-formamido-L-arabinose transferase [Gammaproteobacteria bacterium]